MGTISAPDIWDILESEGYDCDKLTDEQWEDAETDFEEECAMFLNDEIERNKKTILTEWVNKLELSKKK